MAAIRWTQKMNKLSILLINHGYPPLFNAGSEVYTQTLANRLKMSEKTASVAIISREQDPFRADFLVRQDFDEFNRSIPLFLINHAREAPYQRFINKDIERAFENICQSLKFKPDVVHFGHMNHLSLGLAKQARDLLGAKIVYTLHDYWLMCPRGQFLINGVASSFDGHKPYELCSEQNDAKCAQRCFTSRFSTGQSKSKDSELEYWSWWVNQRMEAVREAVNAIDLFIAPSKYIQKRFSNEFSIPNEKIRFLPYGFDHSILTRRHRIRNKDDPIIFGYIGRHAPSKGINLLIEAATKLTQDRPELKGKFQIVIFGRKDSTTNLSLQSMAEQCPAVIEWRPEYKNAHIVSEVFNHVDCIVVPSIWDENSPLVIHEALQCKVPVITANHGGMGELIENDKNGFTFVHRDVLSLKQTMIRAIEKIDILEELGKRGYLSSTDGQVPSIEWHVDQLIQHYSSMNVPRRITFDTNPDDCNFSCIMCEQHSEHSTAQKERKDANIRRRRMDFDIIEKVIAETAPFGLKEIIPSTMGEPLMYRDRKGRTFEDIVKLCQKYNVKLNLTTNGSFFSPQGHSVTEWANLLLPILSDVKFSWNGLTKTTQEKVMKHSKLDQQVKNLKEFLRVREELYRNIIDRPTVTLQLTFMEVNLPEIPKIVEFAVSLGIDRVKGHHLWAHFKEIKNENLRRSGDAIRRWNQCVIECKKFAKANLLANNKEIILENFFELDEISGTSTIHPDSVCPFLGKEAWINHSGRFDPCCAPDKERLSLGYFGNVTEKNTSFLNLWNSESYKKLIKNYTSFSVCKSCNMRKPPT